VLAGVEADLTDGQLLECFVSGHDEAAVAALMRRHGPMVWGVCRRVLRNHHDAEDAFQATFLVLVRKAASILPREMVGNWLYGVAHRTALKARMTTAKRQAREKHVNEMPEPQAVTVPDLWQDLEPLLDQELSRLSDKYQVAIVLCDLEGKTRKEVARQLKISEGTLSSRLTTARTMLAKRLARHGLAVSGGTLAAVLSERAMAWLPPSVASLTIKAATLFAVGRAAATEVTSAKVAALTQGVIKAMLVSRLQMITAVLLVLGLSAFACVVLARGLADGGSPRAETSAPRNSGQPAIEDKDKAKEVRRQTPAPEGEEDRIRSGDRLRVQALNILPDQPIDGVFRVEPRGTVALGPAYGRIQVKGQTLEQAEATIRDHLAKLNLRDPFVSVTRDDSLPDASVQALEDRVRQLEKEVRKLRTTVEDLQKQKRK
jgi:RNA polymerase sigma factor (sigma-70 family)